MEVTGILKVKMDVKQVSDKFKSREFVLTTEAGGKYPQSVIFQLVQDKCGVIDAFKIGDEIKVHINLRGREWTNPQGEVKYFNSLEAWKIEKLGAGNAPQPSAQNPSPAATVTSNPSSSTFVASSGDDDLPF